MIELLRSGGPHRDIPQQHRIFDPFIGNWDLRVSWYEGGEVVREEDGEWSFGWVLEGRAVQDVWIVPPRGERTGGNLYEYGTSVRFYVPALGGWRSTWIGPMNDLVRTFVARAAEGTVVLETDPCAEGALRWIFSDITSDAFRWRNLVMQDGDWRLQQGFECARRR